MLKVDPDFARHRRLALAYHQAAHDVLKRISEKILSIPALEITPENIDSFELRAGLEWKLPAWHFHYQYEKMRIFLVSTIAMLITGDALRHEYMAEDICHKTSDGKTYAAIYARKHGDEHTIVSARRFAKEDGEAYIRSELTALRKELEEEISQDGSQDLYEAIKRNRDASVQNCEIIRLLYEAQTQARKNIVTHLMDRIYDCV
jgi:hypothetical protein